MNPLIIIPARLASTRLPGKPLVRIGDAAMIVQVWRRAMEAKIGDVVVACDSREIADVVEAAGGVAVMTDPVLPSGSDRIHAALNIVDTKKLYDVVLNVQGDMPTLDPAIIVASAKLLKNEAVDIGTLAAVITDEDERTDPAVVKVVLASESNNQARALYFSRATIPAGEGVHYHHIGIYAYRRAALEKFVSLPPSPLEQREKLEQLRALEAGMRIDVAVVDTVPLGVDTPEGLEKARRVYAKQI